MEGAVQARAVDAVVQAVVDGMAQAWRRGDAEGWSRDFVDDATFINVRGDMVKGRAAIERIHAFIFNGPYKGTQFAMTVDEVGAPAPGVAVVETTAEVTRYRVLPPGLVETEPGVLRTRLKLVLVERDGGWRIFAAQNTAISPKPMAVHR